MALLSRSRVLLFARIFGASMAGILYSLSFPNVNIWVFAFLAIAISVLVLRGTRLPIAIVIGFVFGLSFYLPTLSWSGRYLGPGPWLALAAFQTLYIAASSLLISLLYRWVEILPPSTRRSWVRSVGVPAVIAGIWVLREGISGSFPYGGFPWARAALSQSESPFADVVSWVGNTGLSFVIVFIAASIVELGIAYYSTQRHFRMILALPVLVVTIFCALVPAWGTKTVGTFVVGSVQGNGPNGFFDHARTGDVFAAQLAATQTVVGHKIDVLVWPEGGSEFDPSSDMNARAKFLDLSVKVGAPILLNTVVQEGDQSFNTSILVSPRIGVTARYDKIHPVPFGEYIPDRWFFRMLAPDLVDLSTRDYTAGSSTPAISIGASKAGLAICFDVIYDDVIWRGTHDGAEYFLFQTNNADFRGSDENVQQLASARLRAIETGRFVVNISTVGTSQVIDANGRTIDALEQNISGAMITTIERRAGLTPAVWFGEWIPLTLNLATVAACILFAAISRRLRGK